MTFPEVLNINHMIEESGFSNSQSQVSVASNIGEQQMCHLDSDDQRVPDSDLDIEIEDEGKASFFCCYCCCFFCFFFSNLV